MVVPTEFQFLTKEDVNNIDLKALDKWERYKIWSRIPKVELHCHLDICFSLEFFLKILRTNNIRPELSDAKVIDYFLYKDRGESLDEFVSKTRRLTEIYMNYDVLKSLGKEAVYKKHKEGIVLMEFRFSPCYIAQRFNLDYDKILAALKEGIDEAVKELGNTIEVGLICSGEAALSRELLKSAVDFAIRNKKDLIGFDNAGYEVDLKPFKEFYEELTKHNIPLSIHAGEDKNKPNLDAVYTVIEILKAKRIGHGIRVSESQELIDLVKKNDILLEICPISNVMTNNVESIDKHPIKKLYESGVKVSINSDDPGLFLTDLNDEYETLYNNLHFDLKDFIKMNYWALQHSFLREDIKEKLKKKYFEQFDFC